MKYVDVIIPLKFRDSVTYSVPESLEGSIVPGSIVKVTVVGRSYTAVVLRVKDVPGFDPSKIIPLREVVNFPPVTQANMDFLRQVASYYMCSLGEAFRFAAPSTVKALKRDRAKGADAEEAAGNGSGGQEPAGAALPVLWRMNVSEKGGVSCILFRRSPSAVRYRSGSKSIFRAGCWYIIPGRPLRTKEKSMSRWHPVRRLMSYSAFVRLSFCLTGTWD